MKVQYDKCDNCGLEVDCFFDQVGWIEFSSSCTKGVAVTVSKGRKKDRTARTGYEQTNEPLLFCSLRCLTEWIGKLKEAE